MRIIIVGAGGTARELIKFIGNSHEFIGCILTDISNPGQHDSQELIIGDYKWCEENIKNFDGFVIGIGNPQVRLKIAKDIKNKFPNKLFPNIILSPIENKIIENKEGIIIYPGVLYSVNLTLGNFSFVSASVTLGHETTIGDGCVINPGAHISGGVNIGKGTLIGVGACVLQYINIGDFSTVGAGAIVTKNVNNNTVVVGCPAKPLIKKNVK